MPTEQPAIYVDVDDTLVRSAGSKRIPMTSVVSLVRSLKERGAVLYLWSRAGAAYARDTATELGVADCFEAFLPKPRVLLDDSEVGRWGMVELHPAQCAALAAEHVLAKAH